MTQTILIPKKQKITSEDTATEINDCYGGKKWVKEINELFPESEFGCINYGYWDRIPTTISLKEREDSQLNLYRKLLEFAGIEGKSKGSSLEMGCGRGHGVHLLSEEGLDAYGVDMVEAQIQKCIKHYPELRDSFKQAAVNKTGFKSSTFDYIVSVEAAQHFHSFLSFAKESYRLLKDKGKIAITTFFFPSKKAKHNIQDIIPSDISGTHRAISVQEAKDALIDAGFQNIKLLPIGGKTFEGFSKWAAQAMSQKNHTPKWLEAYTKNLIEYYMIVGEKVVNKKH